MLNLLIQVSVTETVNKLNGTVKGVHILNETIKLIQNRHSVRSYEKKIISEKNKIANVKIIEIHQEIPEGGESVSSTGDVTPLTSGDEEEEEGESDLTWLWWVIGAIVVIAIASGVIVKKKR